MIECGQIDCPPPNHPHHPKRDGGPTLLVLLILLDLPLQPLEKM